MIYLIGGAPRAGKSTLCQQLASRIGIGWISTDLLVELLRFKNEQGVKREWNASPDAIRADAEWFLPYLERFVWGVSSIADNYVIEGVDFVPGHVAQLASKYSLSAVFLGCSKMTVETLQQFPGHSRGYDNLPADFKRQIANDVPRWSEFIRQEAERFGYPYIDTHADFPHQLHYAEELLVGKGRPLWTNSFKNSQTATTQFAWLV